MVINEKFIENGKIEIRDFILLCMDADRIDEDGFICPQCEDTVTAIDFPYLQLNRKNEVICPICGQIIEQDPYQICYFHNDERGWRSEETPTLRDALIEAFTSADFKADLNSRYTNLPNDKDLRQNVYTEEIVDEVIRAVNADKRCRANKIPYFYKFQIPKSVEICLHKTNELI